MIKTSKRQRSRRKPPERRGAASLDYVLVICVVLPMVAFIMVAGPRIMRLAYEMVSAMIAWPFM